MAGRKEIITFKVDESLAAAMQGIPNRSAFIRSAILAALNGVCPLCQGTGILTADQKKHWTSFTASHDLVECDQCHSMHIVCPSDNNSHPSVVHKSQQAEYQQPSVSSTVEKTEIGSKF